MISSGPSAARWDWLLLAVMAATLASLMRWAIAQPAVARSRVGPVLSTIARSPWLVHPLRLVHAVGIPAIALFWQHALSAKGLGLKPLPRVLPAPGTGLDLTPGLAMWAQDAGGVMLIVTALACAVALGDRAARRWGYYRSALSERRNWSTAIREGIIHQVRWAFYREPFVFIWGPAVGSWLGTLPVILEAVVSPTFWESLRHGHPAYARATVVRGGFLVSSVLLYLATQNLWLAIVANVVLEGLLHRNSSSPLPVMQ